MNDDLFRQAAEYDGPISAGKAALIVPDEELLPRDVENERQRCIRIIGEEADAADREVRVHRRDPAEAVRWMAFANILKSIMRKITDGPYSDHDSSGVRRSE